MNIEMYEEAIEREIELLALSAHENPADFDLMPYSDNDIELPF